MKFEEIFSRAFPGETFSRALPDAEVLGVETDSRAVGKNFIFIAIQGTKKDGTDFIREAAARGARVILTDKNIPQIENVVVLRVPDARLAAAQLAVAFHEQPSAHLRVIGITGTNGKTTSSYILEHLLKGEQKKPGIIGTISYRYADQEVSASETTPGPLKLQKILSDMRRAGCDHVAMEVSSHALYQKRTAGIDFAAALFTNLTQDHLDYHKTMEDYFEAKSGLFSCLPKEKVAVINTDDEWGRKLLLKTRARVVTYGTRGDATLKAENIVFHPDATEWDLFAEGKKIKVSSPLAGLHNVYNVLGALGVMRGLGFSLESATGCLRSFAGVPGRLEAVKEGQNFKVYVDFAHTPDGLLNVLKSLQEYRKKKLFTVFGCGGDRDRDKRPKMARIAADLSDFVYVTSDNPRSEDPKRITEEICAGFSVDFKNYAVVIDRRKAIRQALMAAREGDIVLLAGKGHERTQVIGSEILPFSDKEEARKVLLGK